MAGAGSPGPLSRLGVSIYPADAPAPREAV